MGFDGIAVESHTKSETVDVTTASMELSYVLGQVRKAIDALQFGNLHEVTVRSDDLTVILRVLTREYFVALAIGPTGNSGKGRYLLRVAAPRLQAEL